MYNSIDFVIILKHRGARRQLQNSIDANEQSGGQLQNGSAIDSEVGDQPQDERAVDGETDDQLRGESTGEDIDQLRGDRQIRKKRIVDSDSEHRRVHVD